MANEFIARKGLIALEDSVISGSLHVRGDLTVGKISNETKLVDVGGNFNFNPVNEPTPSELSGFSVTLAGAGAGNVDNGIHYYHVIFKTADGSETGAYNPPFASVTVSDNSSNGKVQLTGIPTSTDPRVTARDIYRTEAGGNQYFGRKLATISDNTTTTYLDNIADSSLDLTTQFYRKRNTTAGLLYSDNTLFAQAPNIYYTSFGVQALQDVTTGHSIVAIGGNALQNVTSGNDNTGVGYNAGAHLVDGGINTYIGNSSGEYNEGGTNNVNVGSYAGRLQSLGDVAYNSYLGSGAGYRTVGGNNYNIGIGYRAGYGFQGTGNINIGPQSGYKSTPETVGNFNIQIGYNSGQATTGTRNILIGYQNELADPTASQRLNIGNLIYGTNLETGTTVSSGNVGIGVAVPQAPLHVRGNRLLLERSGSNDATIEVNTTNAGAYFKANSEGASGYYGLELNHDTTAKWFIGSYGSNSLEFVRGPKSSGTRSLVIDNSDRVGIGTTSPLSWTKLHVAGHIYTNDAVTSDGYLRVRGTGQADKVLISGTNSSYFNGGNVGIGTTSPVAKLDVRAADGNVASLRLGRIDNSNYWDFYHAGNDLRIYNNAGAGSDILFGVNSSGAQQGNNVGIAHPTPTAALHVSSSGVPFKMERAGYDTYGFVQSIGNGLQVQNFTDARTEMFFKGDGNVGIGTASPGYKLDVNGTGRFAGEIFINGGFDVTTDSGARFRDDVTLSFGTNRIFRTVYSTSSDKLEFKSGSNAIMTLDGDGNLVVEGSITAQEFHTEFVSASIVYQSGSTKFGDTSDDIHSFTGSLQVSGSIRVPDNVKIEIGNNQDLDLYHNGVNSVIANATGELIFGSPNYKFKNSTLSTEWMVINSNGNVGIGTTSPADKLHVTGNILLSNNQELRWQDSGGTARRILELTSTDLLELEAPNRIRLNPGGSTAIDLFDGHNTKYTISSVHSFFDASANESVRITGDGKVGIGTTSPGKRLEVVGGTRIIGGDEDTLFLDTTTTGQDTSIFYSENGTNRWQQRVRNDFELYNYGAAAWHFVIKGSTGNVGIGNSSPATKLDVSGSVRIKTENPILQLLDDNTSIRYAALQMATAGGNWFFSSGDSNTGSGTANSDLWITRANNGSDNRFRFHRDSYAFTVYSGSSARVRLDANGNSYFNGGNVGIGNTSPQANLHIVDSTSSSTAYKLFVGRNNNTNEGLGIAVDDSGTYIRASQDETSTEAHHMTFDVSSSASGDHYYLWNINNTNRMWLNGTGLGIGTTSPQAKLHVQGSTILGPDFSTTQSYTNKLRTPTIISNGAGDELSIASTLEAVDEGPAILLDGRNMTIGSYDNSEIDSGIRFNHINNTPNSDTVEILAAGDTKLIVSASGYVGIGTTSPTRTLEIGTNGGGENILKMHSDVASSYLELQSIGNVARLLATNNTNLLLQSDGSGGYITFNANSAERMRIAPSGNVGIGTTSPALPLHVNGNARITNLLLGDSSVLNTPTVPLYIKSSGTNARMRIEDSDNDNLYYDFYVNEGAGFYLNEGTTTRMFISSSGNVGIGTSTPSSILEISDNTPILKITDNRNLNVGDWDNVSLGALQFATSDTTSPGPRALAEIEAYSGVDAASGPEAELRFKTSTINDSAPINRMVIDAQGRVGIGTTDMGDTFQIHDTSTTSNPKIKIFGYDTAASSAKYGQLFVGTDGSFNINAQDTYLILGAANYIQSNSVHAFVQSILQSNNKGISMQNTQGNYNTVLITDSNNIVKVGAVGTVWPTGGDVALFAAGSEKVRIGSNGNVGIGTTSPAQRLDVSGSIQLDNRLIIDGVESSNPTPSVDQVRVTGYGMIGNRGALYITNAFPGGSVQIGNGSSHNADQTAHFRGNAILLERNVGINRPDTSIPPESLTVEGNISASGDLYLGNNSTINFNTTTGTVGKIVGGSDLSFYSDNLIRFVESDANIIRLVAGTNSGTFNINTTGEHDPNVKLYVNGNSYLNGQVTASGDLYLTTGNIYSPANTADFFHPGSSAKAVRARSIQVSTAYSGTIPDNGILLGTDTTLYRSAATTLRTNGNLIVDGTVTAQEFHTEFVSASILYDSGSTKFGDDTGDTHSITGSILLSGSYLQNGANNNSGKADFAVYTGNYAALSLTGNQAQFGGIDMNYIARFDYDASNVTVRSWEKDVRLMTQASATTQNIQFHTANSGNTSEKMRITGAGNVGIGTTSPSAYLHITPQTNEQVPIFKITGYDNDGNTEPVIYLEDENGNVDFTVYPNAGGFFRSLEVNSIQINNGPVSIGQAHSYPGTQNRPLNIAQETTGSQLRLLSTTDVAAGKNISGIEFFADTAASSQNHIVGDFYAESEGYSSGASYPTSFVFALAGTNENSPTERMRITGDGNVGIGTTNPSTDLEIGDGLGTRNVRIYAQTSIFKANTSGTGEAALYLADNDREWRIQKKNNGNNLTIRDNTQGSDVVTFEAVTGNVGIGTTSPSAKLHIDTDSQGDVALIAGYGSSPNLYVGTGTQHTRLAIASGSYDHQFFTRTSTGIASERLKITGGADTGSVFFRNTQVGINTDIFRTNSELEVRGDITIQNKNGSNPSDAGTLYFAEAGSTWGTDFYGFRVAHEGSNNLLAFQSANLTTVQNILTLERDSGDVGIGTLFPAAKLDVVGSIKVGANSSIFSDGSITMGIDYNNNETNRVFNVVANNSTELFRVQEDGNVGIGTTAPTQKLDVAGHMVIGASGGGYKYYIKRPSDGAPTAYFGFHGANNSSFGISNASGGGDIRLNSNNGAFSFYNTSTTSTLFSIDNSGATQLNKYGLGNNTGTAAYTLCVDASGNIIEEAVGAGTISGESTSGLVAYWDGTTSITGSAGFTFDGTTLTIPNLVETSARRYKENIQPLTGSLDKVVQMQGVSFNKIGESTPELGYIAEEVLDIVPELVHLENGEVEGIHYPRVTALLGEAVKELNDKVKAQELFIKDLVARIEKLENK